MNKTEARIGNFIKYGTHEVILSGIDKDGRVWTDPVLDGYIDNYEGIPLTEDWLINFGFEKESKEYFNRETKYANLLLFYSEHHNKYWYFADVERRQYNSTLPILYVHQLQNLYFALTGKELSVIHAENIS